MTRIIKHREVAKLDVRPLNTVWREQPPQSPENPELVALRSRCAALTGELERARGEIRSLQGEVERAFAEGEAVGRKIGKEDAENATAQALAKLEGGVERALAAFDREIGSLERLAPLLAQEALKLVLEDEGSRSDLMAALIRRQLARLSGQAVLKIEVSRADFSETSKLADAVSRTDVELSVSDDLPAGGCRIRLRLGTLDVGLAQQWGRLSALLDDMAHAEISA